jgi:hypothetical protein
MTHVGWRVEFRRKLDKDVTFVHWFDLGAGCPVNDDGTFNPKFDWLMYGEGYPESKQTEIKSISKLFADIDL